MLLENIDNAEFLFHLYPDGLNLRRVVVNEMLFSYDGPSVEVSIHSSQLPYETPKEWIGEYNRIKLVLDFVEIKYLNFFGWGTMNLCDVLIDRDKNDLLKVQLRGDECNADLTVKWIYFKSINPYLTEG